MSERNPSARGIHYEISKPKESPYDGYFYERVRQVDQHGNLVGIGEQVHRSPKPGSTDGMVATSFDQGRAFDFVHGLGQVVLGGRKNPIGTAEGVARMVDSAMSGFTAPYKSWPGTESPWKRPFDWRTGDTPVDFVPGSAAGEIGDGRGIGRWWEASANPYQGQSSGYGWDDGDVWTNFPLPAPTASLRGRTWKDDFVRDSAAAAGVPSRNNVFEPGFPEPGSVRPLLQTPGATRGTGDVGDIVTPPIPFVPAPPQGAPGGIPGLMADAGLHDPLNPDAPLPGGLVGILQDYLRNIPGRRD